MKNPEQKREQFMQTLIRTLLTTTVIAVILYGLKAFPSRGNNKLTLFEMIWSAIFCVVFGGHWLELLFINHIKFALPKNSAILYLTRIIYWFLSAIPLFFIANFSLHLFSYHIDLFNKWWFFGIIYIGLELVMYAIMQLRLKKSFYNGVY